MDKVGRGFVLENAPERASQEAEKLGDRQFLVETCMVTKLVLHDEQRLCVTYSALMLRKTSQTVTPGTLFAFVPYVNPW